MNNIINITDFSAHELDIYARLSEKQLLHINEPHEGIFIAESPKVIERALNAGYTPISLLLEPQHITGEAADIIAKCPEVPVYTAKEDILVKLTGFKLTRGALCAMKRRQLPQVQEVCANAKRVAVLEDVVNPTNVGAIFRSAAALGIDAVLLTKACSDPLYRRSARVSMGTVFQVPWTFTDSITELKELGFKTAAMALDDNSVSINNPELMSEPKLAIVLGTEGDGLAAKTIADCDYTVKIPMSHGVDSLNVAAASAVAFWQLAGCNFTTID